MRPPRDDGDGDAEQQPEHTQHLHDTLSHPEAYRTLTRPVKPMSRKLIPIAKKQHDVINASIADIKKQQDALSLAANVLVMGSPEEITGQFGVVGAVCEDGIYALVIEVPDIAPAADEAKSA